MKGSVFAAVLFGAAAAVAFIAALTDGNGRLVAASLGLLSAGAFVLALPSS